MPAFVDVNIAMIFTPTPSTQPNVVLLLAGSTNTTIRRDEAHTKHQANISLWQDEEKHYHPGNRSESTGREHAWSRMGHAFILFRNVALPPIN